MVPAKGNGMKQREQVELTAEYILQVKVGPKVQLLAHPASSGYQQNVLSYSLFLRWAVSSGGRAPAF